MQLVEVKRTVSSIGCANKFGSLFYWSVIILLVGWLVNKFRDMGGE